MWRRVGPEDLVGPFRQTEGQPACRLVGFYFKTPTKRAGASPAAVMPNTGAGPVGRANGAGEAVTARRARPVWRDVRKGTAEGVRKELCH